MITVVGLLAMGLLAVLLHTRHALFSPAGILVLVSSVMAAGLVVVPLGFDSLNWRGLGIWLAGLCATVFVNAAASAWGETPAHSPRWAISKEPGVRSAAIVFAVLVLCQLIGVLVYRGSVASAVGANDFSDLTRVGVRAAEGQLLTPGLRGLFFSVSPLLTVWGLYAAIRLKAVWGWAGPVLALLAASQTPGRTSFMLTLGTAFLGFAYFRAAHGLRTRSRFALVTIAVSVLVGAVWYFNSVGKELNKGTEALTIDTWLPAEFQGFAFYWLAGPVAMSNAFASGLNPVEGNSGRSMYVFVRVASAFSDQIHVPETVANYVYTPYPTNAFTGFGDAWFDWGLAGIAIVFGLVGLLSGLSITGLRRQDPAWLWLKTSLAANAMSIPVASHYWELPVVFWGVVGFALFRIAQWSDPRAPQVRPNAGPPAPQHVKGGGQPYGDNHRRPGHEPYRQLQRAQARHARPRNKR